ncbi:ABC transporter permease [Limibacillus halophilus]|uniref:Octopine/nopaline transport system permease protein/arginine/ornithine transport system permease protein n=1 Tax=Limibacillus halophilus TaxID=1579333 RepID=A0A839SWG6_9PROT|nr:ABC transporter permease subunit [Limibacillus halophilus]MBB3066379.1 octopine/nopaline transport system permease protein/arginine/ornithine transport system permease protein [Limibacillus halophilus]
MPDISWLPVIDWGDYSGWGPLTYEYLGRYSRGFMVTLGVTFSTLLVGFFIAIPVAVMRLSRNPLIRVPTFAYMFFFRGTPLIVQLYLFYYGSGQFRPELQNMGIWWFFREPLYVSLLVYLLNTTAYTAEIFRGAIQAVPFGEIEAAKVIGMSSMKRFRRIIFPKAIRIGFPAYTNEVVFLFQAVVIISLVTVMDLFGVARAAQSYSYRIYEPLFFVGIVYLASSYAIFYFMGRVETMMMRHVRDRGDVEAAKALTAKKTFALR